MRLRTFLALTLGCLLGTGLAPRADAQSVARAYDVKALCARTQDFVGPRLGFRSNSGGGAIIDEPDEEETITVDSLMNLIRDNVQPDIWEGSNTIRARSGALIVTAPREVHAKIAYLLAFLRAKHIRTVTLEIAVYRGDSTKLGALISNGPVLTGKRLAALKEWKRVRSGRIKAFSGQRVNLARLRELSVLWDYEVEVAQNERVYDPEIQRLPLGDVDDVRPVLADDGKALLITCRHSSARVVGEVTQFDTGLANKGDKKIGALDQPTVALSRVRTSIWVPAAGTAIVGATSRGDDVEVTVMRHLTRTEKLPARPKAESKRILQLIDARYSAFRIRDFKGPALRQIIHGGGTVGATFSDGGEEGVELTFEALVEMIQANVDEDSWHNSRNRIDNAAGRLLIYQTPSVVEQTVSYVRNIENLRSISVLVRARLFSATPKAQDALAALGGSLSKKGREALEEQLADGADLTTIDDIAVTALPGQRVYAAGLTDRPFVRDYDVEIAHTSRAQDPEVGVVRAGSRLDVRPTLVQQGGRVLLELRLGHAALRSLRVKDIGEGIKVQMPDLDLAERDTNLLLDEGGAGVVDLGGGRYALVEVHVSRVKRKKAGGGSDE